MKVEKKEQISKNKWGQLNQEIINSGYPHDLWPQICDYAFEYLEQGRVNFDVNHTKAVVYWAFNLANNHNQNCREQVDVNTVVTAALLHDIGYHGQSRYFRSN